MPRMRWALVKGWPYKVSDRGSVRSLHTGNIKAIRLDSDGYCVMDLYNKGGMLTVKIHRLVAQAFVPNPKRKPQVNHKDFVRSNNTATNLKWATSKENINHSASAGRMWTRPQCRAVIAKGNVDTMRFFSIKAAERAGHHRYSIYLCLNGKQAHHHGRTWSYEQAI